MGVGHPRTKVRVSVHGRRSWGLGIPGRRFVSASTDEDCGDWALWRRQAVRKKKWATRAARTRRATRGAAFFSELFEGLREGQAPAPSTRPGACGSLLSTSPRQGRRTPETTSIISTLCVKCTQDRYSKTIRKLQATKNPTFFPNCGYDFIYLKKFRMKQVFTLSTTDKTCSLQLYTS